METSSTKDKLASNQIDFRFYINLNKTMKQKRLKTSFGSISRKRGGDRKLALHIAFWAKKPVATRADYSEISDEYEAVSDNECSQSCNSQSSKQIDCLISGYAATKEEKASVQVQRFKNSFKSNINNKEQNKMTNDEMKATKQTSNGHLRATRGCDESICNNESLKTFGGSNGNQMCKRLSKKVLLPTEKLRRNNAEEMVQRVDSILYDATRVPMSKKLRGLVKLWFSAYPKYMNEDQTASQLMHDDYEQWKLPLWRKFFLLTRGILKPSDLVVSQRQWFTNTSLFQGKMQLMNVHGGAKADGIRSKLCSEVGDVMNWSHTGRFAKIVPVSTGGVKRKVAENFDGVDIFLPLILLRDPFTFGAKVSLHENVMKLAKSDKPKYPSVTGSSNDYDSITKRVAALRKVNPNAVMNLWNLYWLVTPLNLSSEALSNYTMGEEAKIVNDFGIMSRYLIHPFVAGWGINYRCEKFKLTSPNYNEEDSLLSHNLKDIMWHQVNYEYDHNNNRSSRGVLAFAIPYVDWQGLLACKDHVLEIHNYPKYRSYTLDGLWIGSEMKITPDYITYHLLNQSNSKGLKFLANIILFLDRSLGLEKRWRLMRLLETEAKGLMNQIVTFEASEAKELNGNKLIVTFFEDSREFVAIIDLDNRVLRLSEVSVLSLANRTVHRGDKLACGSAKWIWELALSKTPLGEKLWVAADIKKILKDWEEIKI